MKKIDLKALKKIINYESLIDYGFKKDNDKYVYKKNIHNNDFTIVIEIYNDEVKSLILDNEFNDEFINIDINTSGEFLGTLKELYDEEIKNFINNCTINDFNYHDQVKEVINYIVNKYQDNIEYLWETTPDSGIFRNKKNNKWYAALLSVKENRVGGNTENIIMVIDLMYYKDKTLEIVDNKKIYPGYHMNKKSWITIRLDGSVENELIYKYIDLSYDLSLKK